MSDFEDDFDDNQDDVEQDVDSEVIDDEQGIEDGQDGKQETDTEQDDSADDDVLEFSFDDDGEDKDEFAGKPAPEWVKNTRNENRELKRQLRELQKRQGQPEQQVLREKPTAFDHDFDEDAYAEDLEQWLTEKQQVDAKVQAEQQKYQQYDERYVNDVNAMKAKAPDYDEIEQSIVDTLPTSRQAMLKMLVDNPAKMVYALGKSPNKLQALSGLDDIQFTKQIVLMEQSMLNVKRNPNKPKPKSHSLEGSAGGGDTKLAKLEADAERTGDRSKVAAYKRNLRNK